MYIRNIVMSTPLFGVSIKMVQHHQCSMSSSPSRLCWSTCIVVASMITCVGRSEDQFDEHVNTFNIRETTVDPEGNLPFNPSRWVTVAAGVWSKRDRSSHTAEPSKHTSNRFLHVFLIYIKKWISQIFHGQFYSSHPHLLLSSTRARVRACRSNATWRTRMLQLQLQSWLQLLLHIPASLHSCEATRCWWIPRPEMPI